jgi:2-haloacid dehalogenase
MFEYLFLDLDDTILDFKKAERIAIGRVMQEFGVEPTEARRQRYHEINIWHWHQLELKKMTRDEVLEGRFEMFFAELGIQVDKSAVARLYEHYLSQGHWFMPGAEEAVEALSKKYKLYLASNGTASVQKGRMTSANLYRFFEISFVSQEIGHNKTSTEYFEAAFAMIPGFDKSKCLMVGDSLTSDIQGGINAGIKTCWVNPNHRPVRENIIPDYQIETLPQLLPILEG